MPTSGIYQITVGPFFYIGSSTDFRRRKADHQWRLRAGIHPSRRMQAEFTLHGSFQFSAIRYIQRNHDESDEQFRNRLRDAEQEAIDFRFEDPNNENKSPNAKGPNNGAILQQRWQDPEFRQYMSNLAKNRSGAKVSKETRAKQSAAKRGDKNHRSRPVTLIYPSGAEQHFPSASALAKFINVSQQSLDLWLRNVVPWPGTGKKTRYSHLIGFSAKFSH